MKILQSRFMYLLFRTKPNNSINFLDIAKPRNADSMEFSIYTKPTIHNTIKLEIPWHTPEQNKSL